jgi:hypothetical protein
MKILVIGNCQARPIAALIGELTGAEMLSPIVSHLARSADEAEQEEAIKTADVVLAQQTADTFFYPWLRSANLRALAKPVVVWPNVFWTGQQPFLRYLTHRTYGRLFGPLEALHDLRLYCSWLTKRGIRGDVNGILNDQFVSDVRAQSLQELQARELTCDVIISNFLAERVDHERLFFTFNHPTALVLEEVVSRIMKTLSLSHSPFNGQRKEPLGRYVVPSLWPDMPDTFQGDGFELFSNGRVERVVGPPVSYSVAELEAAFDVIYDHCPAFCDLKNLRLTPQMHQDKFLFEN